MDLNDAAWRRLRAGLQAGLGDLASGRAALRQATGALDAAGDGGGALLGAAAQLVFIGIADDDYAGFEEAVAVAARTRGAVESLPDAGEALLARAGILVGGWFDALDAPALEPLSRTIGGALGDAAIAPALRCCAGLAALGYHHARMDLEGVLWLDLALRPLLAGPAVGARLAGEAAHQLEQALYQCEAPERAAALRQRRLQHPAGEPSVIAVKGALLDAQVALGNGRAAEGRTALDAVEPLLDPRAPRLASWWHLLRSRLELLEGRQRLALTHARLALRLGEDSRLPERWMGVTVMQEGQVQMAAGAFAAALPFFERAGRAASGSQARFCHALAHLARALDAFERGDAEAGRHELAAGLALARELGWLQFFRPSPAVAAAVCVRALEHGIEPAFVRQVVAARSLPAPRPDLAEWPWPVRVRTFGGLRIELDGRAPAFKGKVAKKPLELLLFVIASGGVEVSAASAACALWSELDGDKARAALNAALHRLRRLLGRDTAIVVEHGRLSLHRQQVWVDCLAFEQLADAAEPAATARALALYRGPFLHEGDDEAWQLSCRARLAGKFKRLLAREAQAALQRGDLATARRLLERGLELDPLAEDLARELMSLHLEAGEQAAALAVFERCRRAIGESLGAEPAASTLALLERLGPRS